MRSEKRKSAVSTFLLIFALFLIGFVIYMYPYIADRWNAYRNAQLVYTYRADMKDTNMSDDYEKELEKADAYNQSLSVVSKSVVTDREHETDAEYESLLNGNSGIMGYIEIPKLDFFSPIFHYSTESVLDRGIGHIHGSSLPVGGENTHCVLTGHRGLPESKLFTDLDQMQIGDLFYLHSLTRDMAYKVVDIKVVLPEEASVLSIEDNRDLVTLVTCTPYGVNTHRLLVTGERTVYNEEEFNNQADEGRILKIESKITPMNAMVAGFALFMILVGIAIFIGKKRDRNKEDKNEI